MLTWTPTPGVDVTALEAHDRRGIELEAAALARTEGDLDRAQYHQDRADTWADIIEVHRGSW
jgi:hypothetical protein